MIRRFFRESLIYAVSSVLARGISLILVPFYTRVLAPADYGTMEILAVVGGLVNIVVVMEISQGVARYFPASQDRREGVGYASTALWFTIAAYSVFFLAAATGSAQLGTWILESEQRQPVFLVAAASMWSTGICYLLQNQLRWEFQPGRYAVVSIVFTLVSTATTVLLVLVLDSGVSGVFWGSIAGSVSAGSLAFWYCRESFRGIPDGAKLRQMLVFSLPLAISGVAVIATTSADRVVVKQLMDLESLGLYGIAQRFASLASLILIGFQGSLTPLMTQRYREPDSPLQLARIFRYFLALSLPLTLALCIYAPEIVMLMTAPPFHSAHTLIPLLATSALLSGMYIFSPGLWLAKKTRITMQINVSTALLNVALTVPLVIAFGLVGAALGSMLSAFAMFASFTFFGQKHYPIPFDWTRILLSVLVSALVVYLASVLRLPLLAAIAAKMAILLAGAFLIWLALLRSEEIRRITRLDSAVLRR